MKRKFRPRRSTIPPISTKRTIASHLKSLNIKKKIPRRITLEIKALALDVH